jgi:hypothetical protein
VTEPTHGVWYKHPAGDCLEVGHNCDDSIPHNRLIRAG